VQSSHQTWIQQFSQTRGRIRYLYSWQLINFTTNSNVFTEASVPKEILNMAEVWILHN